MSIELRPGTTIEARDVFTWVLRHHSAAPVPIPVEAILGDDDEPVGFCFLVPAETEAALSAAGYPLPRFEDDVAELSRRTDSPMAVRR